jgi:transitional endoplasmic reticulum ATPase
VEWKENWGQPTKLFNVLSPRAEVRTSERKHYATDAPLFAVGKWSTKLHDEVYVFDDGHWSKNNELWESVQDCLWDVVILNKDMKSNLIADAQGFFDNEDLYR